MEARHNDSNMNATQKEQQHKLFIPYCVANYQYFIYFSLQHTPVMILRVQKCLMLMFIIKRNVVGPDPHFLSNIRRKSLSNWLGVKYSCSTSDPKGFLWRKIRQCACVRACERACGTNMWACITHRQLHCIASCIDWKSSTWKHTVPLSCRLEVRRLPCDVGQALTWWRSESDWRWCRPRSWSCSAGTLPCQDCSVGNPTTHN